MPRRQQDDSPLKKKLEDIHRRLIGDPTKEELEAMQLHLDVLEKVDQLMAMELAGHHHDHMDDHDHTALQ